MGKDPSPYSLVIPTNTAVECSRWVPWDHLKPLNGNEIAIWRIFEKNDVLRSAYKDFYWRRTLNFWKAHLSSKRLERKMVANNEPISNSTGQKRRREGTTDLLPIQKHNELGLESRVTFNEDLNDNHSMELDGSYQYQSKKPKRVPQANVRESAKYHETSLQDSESENTESESTESENVESEDDDSNTGSSCAGPSDARVKDAGTKNAEAEGVLSKGSVKHLQQETSKAQSLKQPEASLVSGAKLREMIR